MAGVKPGKGKFRVVRAAAVVRTIEGTEQYLYKGAVFDGAQADAESVKHLVAVGAVVAAKAERSAAAAPAVEKPAEPVAEGEGSADAATESAVEKPAAKPAGKK